jgi:hypothetical protein
VGLNICGTYLVVRVNIGLAWGFGGGDVLPVYFLPKNSILATDLKGK